MKNLLSLLIALVFVATPNDLSAQTSSADVQAIELTADDLKVMVRKMADLRRQRIMAWRRQQVLLQRQSARRRTVSQTPGGKPVKDSSTEVINQNTTDRQSGFSAVDPAELAEIRRRLDRQEELLMDIRDRSLTSTAPPATDRPDTIVRQMISRQQTEKGLTQVERQTLADEFSRMNAELNSLRRRLADEEDRRHRAELETERIRNNNTGTRSDDWDDEQRRYERDLNRRRAEEEANRTRARDETRNNERLRYERERREAARNNLNAPPTARVIENESIRIIRDTVVVDRISTTPVYIPTEPIRDTVTIIRDTVIVEKGNTIIQDREVVRTDTLQLKATEPIGFPTIFFDNNSSALNATHRNLLATTVRELNGKTGYTVRITGFASPSGNAAYNQTLSMKRAQAVRSGLEAAGLQSDLIYLVPGGIDHKPVNAAAARRVEIKAIPR